MQSYEHKAVFNIGNLTVCRSSTCCVETVSHRPLAEQQLHVIATFVVHMLCRALNGLLANVGVPEVAAAEAAAAALPEPCLK